MSAVEQQIIEKQVMLEQLQQAFVAFINKVATLPGSPIQKQQAFFRFDEGHMWMKNAITTHSSSEEPEEEVVPDSGIENK